MLKFSYSLFEVIVRENLNFLATAIGSLPHKNPKEAIDLIFNTIPNAPLCPQLSKININEDMLNQYTENFAGIVTDISTNKNYADLTSDEYYIALEELFTDFEELISQNDLNDEILQKYAISEKYSCAFPYFIEKLKSQNPPFVKGQIIGPFTFGTSILDADKKCCFYDETYREVIVKTLTLKALWQVNEFKKVSPNSQAIIFIDEPTMSQLGTSAYITVTPEDVKTSINQIVDVLHQYNILVGIHCCGKADWGMLLDTNIDIVNFDAYFFSHNFSLFTQSLAKFLNKGGLIAWGIVPTLDVEALENITSVKLKEIFENGKNLLIDKGIEEEQILRASILTPSCGAGSLSIENANKAMQHLKELSNNLQSEYSKEAK